MCFLVVCLDRRVRRLSFIEWRFEYRYFCSFEFSSFYSRYGFFTGEEAEVGRGWIAVEVVLGFGLDSSVFRLFNVVTCFGYLDVCLVL